VEEKRVVKHVTDLGASAFCLMNKHEIGGKKGQAVYFIMNESEIDDFDNLNFEYLSSDFHKFDSCLMSLKKMREHEPHVEEIGDVSDLGAAAYILMKKKNKVVGRRGQTFFFDISDTGMNGFQELRLQYLSSEFHRFDACLMSLKKIGDYVLEGI